MTKPYDVCWERIARADKHRAALTKVWNAFIEGDPYVPVARVEVDGTGSISIEQVRPIPAVAALELGEFLYQMRAALDACIYETACVNTGQRPPPDERKLEFPICEDAEAFKNAGWKIAPLTQEQRDIVESVQPYNMPKDLTPDVVPFSLNRTLSILHDWARKDRHRKLHVVASWASNINPQLIIPAGAALVEFNVARDTFVLRAEAQVATFRIDGCQPGMVVNANPNLVLDPAVDEAPLPCHDRDRLGHRLGFIHVTVATIVDRIAKTVGMQRRE